MRLFAIALVSFVLAQSVAGSIYQYARRCKSITEPCIKLRCSLKEPAGYYPFHTLYTCCSGKVMEQVNYVCANFKANPCNPCTQFRCGNGQCTLRKWKCNGRKECKDGSDEVGCSICKNYQFRCRNGRCINRHQVCDKVNQCGDGSDETGCVTRRGASCGIGRFRCRNDRCIRQSYVCDGDNDCKDNSDEKGCIKRGKKRDTLPKSDKEQQDEKEEEKNDGTDTMS